MEDKLAIEGGRPIRNTVLPYGHQSLDEDDINAVVKTLRSDWLTTGPNISEFEKHFADAVGVKYAVAVSSGTAALHSALFAAGIGNGDEVITTPLTFSATANTVRYLGGQVIFADIRRDTLNIDPKKIEAHLTQKTKAIIAVDYAGHPADLDEIKALAATHHIPVIEDAAHALGAKYKGKRVGALANLTTFSFHPVKHITTGEGGMITTDDLELTCRMRMFRNHGISVDSQQRESRGSWFYDITELGCNYRLTDFQCTLGLSQLKKLTAWVKRRNDIAAEYNAAFRDLPEIEPPEVLSGVESSWHLYVIRLNLDRFRVGRDQIFKALRCENIGINVHYIPVPWLTYYQKLGYAKGNWPVAEDAYERMISLPIWPGMSDDDRKDTIKALRKVIKSYRK